MKWKKRKSGILVPKQLWFVTTLLYVNDPIPNDAPAAEAMYWHYWASGTESFTRWLEQATSFESKKAAEAVAFDLTIRFPHKVGEFSVISKMPSEIFIEDQP